MDQLAPNSVLLLARKQELQEDKCTINVRNWEAPMNPGNQDPTFAKDYLIPPELDHLAWRTKGEGGYCQSRFPMFLWPSVVKPPFQSLGEPAGWGCDRDWQRNGYSAGQLSLYLRVKTPVHRVLKAPCCTRTHELCETWTQSNFCSAA